MSGENYASLKQHFLARFNIGFDRRVDQIIQDITRSNDKEGYNEIRQKYPRFSSQNFYDNISALILSRSIDIVITRRGILDNLKGVIWQSTFENVDNVTPSDVLHSIVTMPCGCPILRECCPGITSGSLEYITVFPKDTEFLRALGFSTIDSLAGTKRDFPVEDLTSTWKRTLRNRTDMTSNKEYLTYLSKATEKKLDLWKYTCTTIAAPLIDTFRQ